MIARRLMSWLLPNRLQSGERAKLDALVSDSLSERDRAVEAATTMELQTDADRQRVQATIAGIQSRIALQERRAAARQLATTADARARLLIGDVMSDAVGRKV